MYMQYTICNVYLHVICIRYTNIFSSREREREKKRGRQGERERGGGCICKNSIQYVTCICI